MPLLILSHCSPQGRMKTFSTCATQGCIISLYYIPRFFVYSTPFFPNLKMTPDKRIATTLIYSLFPPLINPLIYCLRTKEIKQILTRWVQRRRDVTPTKHGQIFTVTKSQWQVVRDLVLLLINVCISIYGNIHGKRFNRLEKPSQCSLFLSCFHSVYVYG